MKQKILIIGDTGFIGANLQKYLNKKKKFNIYKLDKKNLTKNSSVNYYVKKIKKDTIIFFCAAVRFLSIFLSRGQYNTCNN